MEKKDLSRAIKALDAGEIIVYPTDTLYALGAYVYNEDAVRHVFKVKKRPFNVPLPVAVSDINGIKEIAEVKNDVSGLVKKFLPGPLTLILNKKDVIPNVVTSDLDKIAIRIPDNDIALELLSKIGPITVTSANIHGIETPYNISDIKSQFKTKDISVYLNYGTLEGLPSSIVDMTTEEPSIIREGIISKQDILRVI